MRRNKNVQVKKKKSTTEKGQQNKMTKVGECVIVCVTRAREFSPSDRVLALLEDDRCHLRHRRGSSSVVGLFLCSVVDVLL